MADQKHKKQRQTPYSGSDYTAPYPVSKLAPAFGILDLAHEIEQADRFISTRANARLDVIVSQIKILQEQARQVLAEAAHDQKLHRARCTFVKKTGGIYHLYRNRHDQLYFSMLSPDDWQGKPPDTYEGSYRLQSDMSWLPADMNIQTEVDRFLRHFPEKSPDGQFKP